jgi:cytochrome P450
MASVAPDLLDIAVFSRSEEHALFRRLRQQTGLAFNAEPDGPGFWSVTRYADVVAAARDHGPLISGQGTQIKDRRAEGHGHPSVHNSDPPLHGRLRAIVLPSLSRQQVEARSARIAGIAARLVDSIEPGVPFDFVARIAVQLPMLVIADVLGVPDCDAGALVGWANRMSDVGAGNAEQAEARAQLFGYFRGLADERRRKPADDVATALVASGLEDGALDAFFMLLTVAGNETTRFLLTGGLAQLARQPDDYARVRADRRLVQPLIEEMCRLVSPVAHMRRTAAADIDLCGTSVPRGGKVVLWFASANHDEAVFDAPDRLVPGRAPNPHVGFGIGAHFCVGAHLARLESRLFLDALFDRVGRFELVGVPERLPSNWFTGWTSLPVRLS